MIREAGAAADLSPAPPNQVRPPGRPSLAVANINLLPVDNTNRRPIGTVSLNLFVLPGPTDDPTPRSRSIKGAMGFDPTGLVNRVLGRVILPSSFDLYLSMDAKPKHGGRGGLPAAFRVVTGRIRFPPALPVSLPDSFGYSPSLGFVVKAKKELRPGAGGHATLFEVNGTITTCADQLPRPADAYRIAANLTMYPIQPTAVASFIVTGHMLIAPTNPLLANPPHQTQPLSLAPGDHPHDTQSPYPHDAGLPSSGLPSLTYTDTTYTTAQAASEDLAAAAEEPPPVRWAGVADDGIGFGMGGKEAWWSGELLAGPVSGVITDEDLMELDGDCDAGGWGGGSGELRRDEGEEEEGWDEYGGYEYDEEEEEEEEDEEEGEGGYEYGKGLQKQGGYDYGQGQQLGGPLSVGGIDGLAIPLHMPGMQWCVLCGPDPMECTCHSVEILR